MGSIENARPDGLTERPVPLAYQRRRNLPASAAFGWLAVGWRDFLHVPGASLAYGLAVFAVSVAVVWALFALGLDYILFPALAGFMVVGPLIAIGLYQKSRDLADGKKPSLAHMLFALSVVTGLFGLIIAFPVLGHGTWHSYKAIHQTGR